MQFYYDFELDDNIEQPKDPNNIALVSLKEFVKSRYSLLEPEIDNLQPPDKPAFIVLCLEEDGFGIKPINVPAHLLDKLAASITEDDFNYITSHILSKIEGERRKN